MYTAYQLTDDTVNKLKSHFNIKYADFIGHHITVKFGVTHNEQLPMFTDDIFVIGEACHDNVQALLVSINGNTNRPSGGVYHITWSIDRSKGKKPVDSNKIIHLAQRIAPIKIKAIPVILG